MKESSLSIKIYLLIVSKCFQASQSAQTVQNLPAMQKTQVQPLGWEVPLEKEMQPTLVFLPEDFHGLRTLVGYSPWGYKELMTPLQREMAVEFFRMRVPSTGSSLPLLLLSAFGNTLCSGKQQRENVELKQNFYLLVHQ